MPPKRRPSGGAAKSKLADIDSVTDVQNAAATIIQSCFDNHHHKIADGPLEGHRAMPWPFDCGGTYHDVCARAWEEPGRLIALVHDALLMSGICESSALDEFGEKFCKMDVFRALVCRRFFDPHSQSPWIL
jgi:hypothetical protein